MNRKSGFTLAEVLITLAIIGIVAALTIPTVVSNYNKNQYYTRFMKTFNTLSNALLLAQAENGNTSSWDYENSNFVDDYLAQHLNIINSQSLPDYTVYWLNGEEVGTFDDVFNEAGNVSNPKYYTMADGSAFCVYHASPDDYVVILFDINGEKAPNTFGRDIFQVVINRETGKDYLISSGAAGENNCNCSVDGTPDEGEESGMGCPDRLIKEGKMNY